MVAAAGAAMVVVPVEAAVVAEVAAEVAEAVNN
jgi:hypothetical protein